MFSRTAHQIIANRVLLSAIVFLLCIVAAIGAKDLQKLGGYKIFFDSESPQLKALNTKESVFSGGDDIIFVFESKSGNIFTYENLKTIEEYTTKAWELPNSTRVNSLTNFQDSSSIDDELVIENLFESERDNEQGSVERIRNRALTHPELLNAFVGPKAEGSMMQVRILYSDDIATRVAERKVSVAAARELIDNLKASNDDLHVHLIGRSLLNSTMEELSNKDLRTLIPIMFLLIIAFMVVLTRSGLATLSILIVTALSIVVAHGFMGWMGFSMNQANSQISVVLLTIGVCNCIHLLSGYSHHFSELNCHRSAIEKSLASNYKNILLTNLTTTIGFLTLNFSTVPPYRELGNIIAVGIFSLFILSTVLLPFLLILFKVKPKAYVNRDSFISGYVDFLTKYKNRLLIAVSSISILIAGMMFTNNINDNIIDYFGPENDFRLGAEYIQEDITGFEVINFTVDSGVENGITEPEYIRKLEKFEEWLSDQHPVVFVRSMSTTFKRLNKNMNSDNPEFYRIPESKELASQYLLLYELSLPYGLGTDEQINFDKSSTLVTAMVRNARTSDMLRIESDAEAWLANNMGKTVSTTASSISLMFSHIGMDSIFSMLYGSILSLVLISLTIAIFMKSMKYGLISLVPNALPALVVFGFWGIFVGEVNMPVAIIFSVTLGIIVDDTIHLLGNYEYAKSSLKYDAQKALAYTLSESGRAIIITTIILATGFFVLGTSDFVLNSNFGIMVASTIIIALILDFILLPLVLLKADQKADIAVQKASPEATIA